MKSRRMKKKIIRNFFYLSFASVIVHSLACSSEKTNRSEPTEAIETFLQLHGLKGRLPDDRSESQKESIANKDDLKKFISDIDSHDPFIADIYVGFVLGALAANQNNLFVQKKGDDAVVSAGQVKLQMSYVRGKWKIVLASSVPDEIKKRAVEEKKRVEEAKARSKGVN